VEVLLLVGVRSHDGYDGIKKCLQSRFKKAEFVRDSEIWRVSMMLSVLMSWGKETFLLEN
jgi:hypothetical protein